MNNTKEKTVFILADSKELSSSLKRYLFFVIDESLNIFTMSFETSKKCPMPFQFFESEILVIECNNIIKVNDKEYIDNYGLKIFCECEIKTKILLYNVSSREIPNEWEFCFKIPSYKKMSFICEKISKMSNEMEIEFNNLEELFPTMYKIDAHHKRMI